MTIDIVKLAKDSGIDEEPAHEKVSYRAPWFSCTQEELERFYRAAYEAGANAEREECAKVCDSWATRNHVYVNGAIQCGKDIRARSTQ